MRPTEDATLKDAMAIDQAASKAPAAGADGCKAPWPTSTAPAGAAAVELDPSTPPEQTPDEAAAHSKLHAAAAAAAPAGPEAAVAETDQEAPVTIDLAAAEEPPSEQLAAAAAVEAAPAEQEPEVATANKEPSPGAPEAAEDAPMSPKEVEEQPEQEAAAGADAPAGGEAVLEEPHGQDEEPQPMEEEAAEEQQQQPEAAVAEQPEAAAVAAAAAAEEPEQPQEEEQMQPEEPQQEDEEETAAVQQEGEELQQQEEQQQVEEEDSDEPPLQSKKGKKRKANSPSGERTDDEQRRTTRQQAAAAQQDGAGPSTSGSALQQQQQQQQGQEGQQQPQAGGTQLENPQNDDERYIAESIRLYKAELAKHIKQGRAKPDMIAYSATKHRLGNPRHGEIPGVRIGSEWLGRGEVAIVGLHQQMMRGIDWIKAGLSKGAYAIVMSGGYKDDADAGSCFWYTGEGGQQGKKQTSDQKYERGNLALKNNLASGEPVRVIRGKVGPKNERIYVYEGLYKVTEAKMEPSSDGPLVCRFKMEGVPGRHIVSSVVEFNLLARTKWARWALKRQRLAGAEEEEEEEVEEAGPSAARRPKKRAKKSRTARVHRPTRAEVEASIQRRNAEGPLRGRLLCADISGGKEPLPIPVWDEISTPGQPAPAADPAPAPAAAAAPATAATNGSSSGQQESGSASAGGSSDSKPAPSTPADAPAAAEEADEAEQREQQSASAPATAAASAAVAVAGPWPLEGVAALQAMGIPDFAYLNTYQYGRADIQAVAEAGEEAFKSGCKVACGVQWTGSAPYTADGLMASTQPCGLMECDEGCDRTPHCKHNRQVARGLCFPLEVFKTAHKGWGVRCSEDLPAGAVLCAYTGLVITDDIANGLRGQDHYLFDLNHFHNIQAREEEDAAAGRPPESDRNPNLPKLKGPQLETHLVVDARLRGNVARFINHSCKPNCVVQPVMSGFCRSHVLYYSVIVTSQFIPAGTELQYDYAYGHAEGGTSASDGVTIACHCGAPGCIGSLLS